MSRGASFIWKRAWNPGFLSSLGEAKQNDPIWFELVGGRVAAGKITHLKRAQGQIAYVSGQLSEPENGRFFFQEQSRPGVAGKYVGVVEFPGTQKAYRIEPSGPDGAPELIERPLGEVVCLSLAKSENNGRETASRVGSSNGATGSQNPIPLYQNGIISLESLHGATAVIYLDFQGGYTETWGGITYDKPDVSNDQIQEVFERVSEDFMPFNINVTTDLSVFQHAPEGSRQRVIITPSSFPVSDYAGIGYIGSFNWTGDTPCWSFNISGKACAETCSHELGHTLGLSHQGQGLNAYYNGQGVGETGWAPIMGMSLSQNVSQWSKGEYLGANNQEDALEVIASQNNDVAYCPDDTGDTLATSRFLEVYPNFSAGAQGVIERTEDTDAFQFTTAGGLTSLRADPAAVGPNLALQAALYDANDTLLATSNPQDTLSASLTTNLSAGTYTFRVSGAGRNDPLTNGFSNYGSLGYYSITGSVANARLPDRFSIVEHSTNGTAIGIISVNNTNHHSLTFSFSAGNLGNAFGIDNSGVLTVSQSDVLDYETLSRDTRLPVQIESLVAIEDLFDGSLSETNRRVVVSVTPSNTPPTIATQPKDSMVPAGITALLSVSVIGRTPMDYQWFFDGATISGGTASTLTITNVQATNSGNYFVTATNLFGGATSTVAALVVQPASPIIVTPPASQTVLPGTSASFNVAARGTEPFTYQWQFNSTNIPDATNSTLILTDILGGNLGSYTVVVFNSAGSTVSRPAILAGIPAPPLILKQPTNQTVYLAGMATLQVGADGWTPLGYQWRSNNADIPGATNSLLELDGIEPNQAGSYYVLVSNLFGVLSSSKASLDVLQIVAWGNDSYGQTDVPPGVFEVVKVACGTFHNLALKNDGTLLTWTKPPPFTQSTTDFGQYDVPDGLTNVLDIAAGSYHNVVLNGDGTVTAWGAGTNASSQNNNYGQSMVPVGLHNLVGVAAGERHSAALTADGQVVVWGRMPSAPDAASNVVAIASAGFYMLALRADGVLVSWNTSGPLPMISNVVAIAAGIGHRLALLNDGTARSLDLDPAPPGLTNVIKIAARSDRCMALTSDDRLVTWGTLLAPGSDPGPSNLPRVNTIACGSGHSVVVLGDGSPQLETQPPDRTLYPGNQTVFIANADGTPPLRYQWQFNEKDMIGATNAWLSLTNLQSADAGDYRVIVTNGLGRVVSRSAKLLILGSIGQAVDAPGLNWISTGSSWYGQALISHDGISAAQSGAIGDSQQTAVQTTVTGSGTLSFWWKVSSEQWFDYLTFYIDEVQQLAISGEVDWGNETFSLSSGTHSLTWTYSKDASDNAGLDASWIDQVTFVPDVPTFFRQPKDQTVDVGGAIDLAVQAAGTPPLSYQWLKNGTNLVGQTSSSLTISNVSRHDSGIYEVAISNANAVVFSSSAFVVVRVPEKLTNAQWNWMGQFTLQAADADGAALWPSDLPGFQAQTSTNLSDWEPLNGTLTLTNGRLFLLDLSPVKSANRFYRILETERVSP